MNGKDINIFIVGYMGSGKSTIGKALAERLEKSFIDMDEKIENEQDMTVNRIFMKYGEHQFRNYEAELLDKIIADGNMDMIVSCGGGILLDNENKKILRDEVVVYLECDPKVMFERIKNNPDLPNAYFHIKDEGERLRIFSEQNRQRQGAYEDVCDIKVETSSGDIDDIATKIVDKIRGTV